MRTIAIKKYDGTFPKVLYISKRDGINIKPGTKVKVWIPYEGNVTTGMRINVEPDLKKKWYKEYRLEIMEDKKK